MSTNLMKNKVISTVFKSKWFPAIPQAITIWVFMVITWQLLFGPSDADYNLGSLYTWILWWPLLPITFLLTGRFWCAICPFGLLNDVVQKAIGRNKPVPKLIKTYGIWFIDALFIFITWADHLFGIFSSPILTGGLMLILITGVVVSGALWQRRTWCRHLCFLGGLAGNYARNSMVELRATPEKCSTCKSKAACFNGTASVQPCPVFEFPRTMENSVNCNLCGNCVKSCPNDSIQIRVRPPSKEIFSIHDRKSDPKMDEAFLAIVVMGIVLIKNTDDFAHAIWAGALQSIQNATHTPYAIAFTILFLIVVNIPGIVLTLMSFLAQVANGDSWKLNLTRFGFALIPLDMALVVSNTCPDLLGNGRALIYSALALFGVESGDAPRNLVAAWLIRDVQIGLVIAGALLSLHAVYRISHHYYDARGHVIRTLAPYSAMVAGFAGVMLYIFSHPKPVEDAGTGVTYVAHDHNQLFSVAVVFGAFVLASWATAWARTPRAKAKKIPAREAPVGRGSEFLPVVLPAEAANSNEAPRLVES
ncbi:MAG: 4Fe-4S binding protein [Candidatus Baltobacteraceae bacterium]|jgi:polyferredoxin